MKMNTSGEIYRLIKKVDNDTVIRRLNVRQKVRKLNVKYNGKIVITAHKKV